MQDSGIIRAYVDLLAGKLDFDPSLSRRVRHEIEDHLWEAVARVGSGRESEQRAVANFGDPQLIAVHLATAWLTRQTQKIASAVILVIVGALVAMKARVAWYGVAQWGLSEEARAVAQVVARVDACAFWLAIMIAILGLAYLFVRRAPPAAHYAAHYRQVRRVLFASALSTAALIVSVIGDGTLTGLRLMGRELSAGLLVPISSMIVEIGCAGILVFMVRTAVGRMAQATALLKT
jgi:hypothetical protein